MDDSLGTVAQSLAALLAALPRCSYCQVRAGVAADANRFPLCEVCLIWAPLPRTPSIRFEWDIRGPLSRLRELLGLVNDEVAPQEEQVAAGGMYGISCNEDEPETT